MQWNKGNHLHSYYETPWGDYIGFGNHCRYDVSDGNKVGGLENGAFLAQIATMQYITNSLNLSSEKDSEKKRRSSSQGRFITLSGWGSILHAFSYYIHNVHYPSVVQRRINQYKSCLNSNIQESGTMTRWQGNSPADLALLHPIERFSKLVGSGCIPLP